MVLKLFNKCGAPGFGFLVFLLLALAMDGDKGEKILNRKFLHASVWPS